LDRRTYTVLLEPDPEWGGFTATVPAIPEVVTEGDDEAHALAMAREAIELYLRYADEKGLLVPVEPEPYRLAVVEVEVEALAAAE
jgi:antitoxin HicB